MEDNPRRRSVETDATRDFDGRAIRVAIAGAGFLGRGLVNQLARTEGVHVVALADRHPEKARAVALAAELEPSPSVGEDALALAEAGADVVVDCTGDPLLGHALASACIPRRVAFVASAECDSCFGAALGRLAARHDAVYGTGAGDEHGEVVRLVERVREMALDVVAAGKFKDFLDAHATPTSVAPWAERHAQNAFMLASFADGTKMSQEMAVVCNATGLVPDVRGMHVPSGTREQVAALLAREPSGLLSRTGVVEVVRGAQPSAAVFVVATSDRPQVRADLAYLKMGDGPNYLFYKPYHLCAFELARSVVAAVRTRTSTARPRATPVADVFACAKRDLAADELLDRTGGFTFYGRIDRAERIVEDALLPVALAAGARVVRRLTCDEPIRMADVELTPAAARACLDANGTAATG